MFTVGGVATPGQTLMTIVPEDDSLFIGAGCIRRASTRSTARRWQSSFPPYRSTTPECHGTSDRVSPDLVRDEQNNVASYAARILIGERDACLEDSQRLVPGMPVEVHIRTGERSVWSYLMKPLLDQLNRAMRE